MGKWKMTPEAWWRMDAAIRAVGESVEGWRLLRAVVENAKEWGFKAGGGGGRGWQDGEGVFIAVGEKMEGHAEAMVVTMKAWQLARAVMVTMQL